MLTFRKTFAWLAFAVGLTVLPAFADPRTLDTNLKMQPLSVTETLVLQRGGAAVNADAQIPTVGGAKKFAFHHMISVEESQKLLGIVAAPDSGDLVNEAYGEGAAPLSATQRMIFQIELNKYGTDVYDAMTGKGQGGVGVVATVEFMGLTPKASVKIRADYKAIAKHYSKNEKLKTTCAASAFGGLLKANATWESDMTEALNELKKDGALVVEVIGNEKYDSQKLNELVAPILARINTQILEIQKSPDKIDPAVAKDPKAEAAEVKGGWGASFARSQSTSVKDIKDVKEMVEVIDMNFRDVALRTTIVSGLIGVQNYSPEIREGLFVFASKSFQNTVISLPEMSSEQFKSAMCNSWYTAPGFATKFDSKIHKWSGSDKDSGWKTAKGEAATYAQFGYTSLDPALAKSKADWMKFTVHYEIEAITASGQKVHWADSFGATNGSKGTAAVSKETQPRVELDWALLPWGAIGGDAGAVLQVNYEVVQGGKTVLNGTARQIKVESALGSPPVTKVYYAPKGGPVTLRATAIFLGDDKKPVRKTWNAEDDISKQNPFILGDYFK